ncbi:MAG: hypothetical protein KBI47_00930 [Armatimonadetes bacterium]|nr:hypothetical protein [Armatimonadota bacterium]
MPIAACDNSEIPRAPIRGSIRVFGDGQYTVKIAYTIILFGLCVLGLQALDCYTDWPW